MKKLLLCLILSLMPVIAHSWNVVPGGIQVTIAYAEPNLNSDGTVLKDLGKTQVFYNLGTGGDVKCFEANASALTGGGNITGTVIIPWPSGKQGNVDFYAVAIDTSSNVSAKTGIVTVQFDTLAPGTPKVLQISGNFLFFSFREPFTNTDGSTLNDLAEARIYCNDSQSATLRLIGIFTATSSNGGGSQNVSFPLNLFTKGTKTQFFARFADERNNLSPFPQPVAIQIPQ